MGIHVMKDATLSVGGTDLSNHVRSITVTMSAEDVDITAMGATARAHLPGLRDDRIEVEMYQDFAASSVDATLSSLVGSATGASVVVKPTSSAVSSTNPSYTLLTAILLDYPPFAGTVGDADTINVTFVPGAGDKITRATA